MSNNFKALGIGEPRIIAAITELGFESPTAVQEKVIPALLAKPCDMIALAQTGTGKTAAFGLPLVTLIDFAQKEPKALILAPTRELCMQVTSDLKNFSKNIPGANVVAVYGGASIRTQIDELHRGAQIIVATPGRMTDIINRKKVYLENIQYVVLDEADEMLNMGFKDDLDFILSAVSGDGSAFHSQRQINTWLFSATMPDDVLRISRTYQKNPVEITIGTKNLANENIEHIYYVIGERDRYKVLKRIADFYPDIFGLVFCRTKIESQKVADMLIKDGYNADALHGDLSQAQRDHVMKKFRSHTLQMLVATDVAARGLDVSDITHVIHYNLPDEIENYTHRSGRTARAGKTGISIVLINARDLYKIKTLEKIAHKKFTKALIPTGYEICEKQLFNLVQGIHNAEVNEEAIKNYLPKVYEELSELSREEIIKRFVSIEFNRFLDYYKDAPDLNMHAAESAHSEKPGHKRREGFVRLFVSLGKMDGLDSHSLTGYLKEQSGLSADNFGSFDVKNSFSFIEVKKEVQQSFINSFHSVKYNGRPVRIEEGGKKSGNGRDGMPGGVFKHKRPGNYRDDKHVHREYSSRHGKSHSDSFRDGFSRQKRKKY